MSAFFFMSYVPGENMSGLKRISKHVLLMEPTALQAFRTTSRLLASVVIRIQAKESSLKQCNTSSTIGQLISTIGQIGETSSVVVSAVDQ